MIRKAETEVKPRILEGETSPSMVDPVYRVCESCGRLEGGLFGRGPLRVFSDPERHGCAHRWRRTDRESFLTLAGIRFGIDWRRDSAFLVRLDRAVRS